MESWRTVWRRGIVPVIPTHALESLLKALEDNDPRLIQSGICQPAPCFDTLGQPVSASCLFGWLGWQGGDNSQCRTVYRVEQHFTRFCAEADKRFGEVAAVRWFLNWYDETPRDEMRTEMLYEVLRELGDRMTIQDCGDSGYHADRTVRKDPPNEPAPETADDLPHDGDSADPVGSDFDTPLTTCLPEAVLIAGS